MEFKVLSYFVYIILYLFLTKIDELVKIHENKSQKSHATLLPDIDFIHVLN